MFEEIVSLTLQTSFDGGRITSDGGLAWLERPTGSSSYAGRSLTTSPSGVGPEHATRWRPWCASYSPRYASASLPDTSVIDYGRPLRDATRLSNE